MKKVDSATGMTIEVPASMTVRSKFPYPGFWSAAYPQLVQAIQKHALPNENRSAISEALTNLINLSNGEQAIILSERIWYIGELMELNNTLPVIGRSGMSLGYINESADGGRMQVAARLFEQPIRAILAQTSSKTTATNEVSNLLNEHTQYRRELEKLTRELRSVEKDASTRELIAIDAKRGPTMAAQIIQCEKELEARNMRIQEMINFRTYYSEVKKEHDKNSAEVERLQRMVKNYQNSNSPQNAAAASNALGPLLNRVQSSGLWLRKSAGSVDNLVLKDLQNIQNRQSAQLQKLQSDYSKWEQSHSNAVNKYNNAVTKARGIWSEMKTVTNHIQSMESNISNAQNAMSGFTELESSKLTRIWVEHISSCRTELEALLFRAKANAMGAIEGSPTAMMAEPLVDPRDVKDYEEFIDALNMIGDMLDDMEYELIEEIGRLGLSMGYVPGASRILALSELRRTNRIVAYRNLIEEILSQGQKLSDEERFATLDVIGNGTIFIESDKDLVEVKELLRHLADSRLNFKYGGGN